MGTQPHAVELFHPWRMTTWWCWDENCNANDCTCPHRCDDICRCNIEEPPAY